MVLTSSRSHRDMSLSIVINRPALATFLKENERWKMKQTLGKYPTIGAVLMALSMCISSISPSTDIILSSEASISNGLLEPCVRAARAAILRDLDRWIHNIDNVRRIMCWGRVLGPSFEDDPRHSDRLKTIQDKRRK